jgi:hypothetical protein
VVTAALTTEADAAAISAKVLHEDEWPPCEGKCHNGACALRWDHPACCTVPARHAPYYGRSLKSSDEERAPNEEGTKANVAGGAYYDEGRLYCWN